MKILLDRHLAKGKSWAVVAALRLEYRLINHEVVGLNLGFFLLPLFSPIDFLELGREPYKIIKQPASD